MNTEKKNEAMSPAYANQLNLKQKHSLVKCMQTWTTREPAYGIVCNNNKYCTVFDTNIYSRPLSGTAIPSCIFNDLELIFIVIKTNTV